MPYSYRNTDEGLFASLSGDRTVIDWLGYRPTFHDAELERLEIAAGNVALTLRTFRMTKQLGPQGYFVLDRHSLVTMRMSGVSGIKLTGNASSIISELRIRRLDADEAASNWETCGSPVSGDIEVTFDTSFGLYGSIYAKELVFELQPLAVDQGQ